MTDDKTVEGIPPWMDFASDSFDSSKFLACTSVVLPFPNAKTYNNIAEYYTHTFLKKAPEESQKIHTEPVERDYNWYYKTLGLSQRRGDYFRKEMQKRRYERPGKKRPANILITPSLSICSNSVTTCKSDYVAYWQRKWGLYKKPAAFTDSDSLLQYVKTLSNVNHFNKNDNRTVLKKILNQRFPHQGMYYNSTVSEPVENNQGLCKDQQSDDLEIEDMVLISKEIQSIPTNRRALKTDNNLATINPNNSDKELYKSKENVTLVRKIPLYAKEESLVIQTGINVVDSSSYRNEKFSQEKKLHSKNHLCTCKLKTTNLSSQCNCGVYSNAMNNVLKFKIPRKRKLLKD